MFIHTLHTTSQHLESCTLLHGLARRVGGEGLLNQVQASWHRIGKPLGDFASLPPAALSVLDCRVPGVVAATAPWGGTGSATPICGFCCDPGVHTMGGIPALALVLGSDVDPAKDFHVNKVGFTPIVTNGPRSPGKELRCVGGP